MLWHDLEKSIKDRVNKGELRDLSDYYPRKGVSKNFLDFTSNDYLGLSSDSNLQKQAWSYIKDYSAGGCSSRMCGGQTDIHLLVESLLSKIKKTESSVVYGSGYVMAQGLLSAIISAGDLLIMDKFIHASWLKAALSVKGCEVKRYSHCDLSHLEKILQKSYEAYRRIFIITETIFSMDGDVSDIGAILKLCQKYNAILIEDDAHGLGVITNNSDLYADCEDFYIKTGTLSKSIGSCGGYVSGKSVLKTYLLNNSASIMFSTSLPPFVLAFAYFSLQKVAEDITYLEQEDPDNSENKIKKLKINIQYMRSLVSDKVENYNTPIFIIKIEGAREVVRAHKDLLNAGIQVSAIRSPTVMKGSERLRISIRADHSQQDISDLVSTLNQLYLL